MSALFRSSSASAPNRPESRGPLATIPIHSTPLKSAEIDIYPNDSKTTLTYRLWAHGEHRHAGKCISLPAPEGFVACIANTDA